MAMTGQWANSVLVIGRCGGYPESDCVGRENESNPPRKSLGGGRKEVVDVGVPGWCGGHTPFDMG